VRAALAAMAILAAGATAPSIGAERSHAGTDAGSSVRAERGDGGAGADSKGDPDEDLIRHIEEIENLELLENLELFDPGPEEEEKR
jgi:hypothetical protein